MNDDLMSDLYYFLTGDLLSPEAHRAAKAAEPYFNRLCEAWGMDEADKLWNAAADIGAADNIPAFRAGLCFGLRLMSLCLVS